MIKIKNYINHRGNIYEYMCIKVIINIIVL